MKRKYLAFDIETAKEVPGEDFNWKAHRPLGISCAATVTSKDKAPRLWSGNKDGASPAPKMSKEEVADLVHYLAEQSKSGFTVVTWNGLAFDLDILAEESGLAEECKALARQHVDMMFHVLCVKGFPVGLDNAAKGMRLPGKPEGMSGVDAPRLWKEGQHGKVLEYVAQDVQTTLDLAKVCEQRRALNWLTRRGSRAECRLPKGWVSVEEALRLPLPDTSWMDNPLTRQYFTGWLGG